MRKRVESVEQGSLFEPAGSRRSERRPADEQDKRWKMPATGGATVAEIRVRWSKRLTPAQVAKVEAELHRLPPILSKLGFGTVEVERVFVRRRKD